MIEVRYHEAAEAELYEALGFLERAIARPMNAETIEETDPMPMKKMRITIKPAGRTEIRVEGGEGGNCLDFTKAMEQALGTVQARELTADHEREPVPVLVQETEGVTL